MSAGVWLVVAGGLLVFVMSFVFWGAYSEKTELGWSAWSWQFDVGAWAWTGLWPPDFFGWHWWEEWRGWVGQGLWVAWMVMVVLCAVASIQALRRGLSGAPVNGHVLRAFGIAAAVVFVEYEAFFMTDPAYRSFFVTDMAAILGAVLIIVGGTLLGPATTRGMGAAAGAAVAGQ